MIEEPYRWVEAIANRREYIEIQLAAGSPIAAVGYRDGILFVTLGRARQKIFEIYDRIAMGAIGHPGDIERLRMAAIELASTEGFTRSAADVSLRRLAHYSLSPVMKSAFEQVYGAPFLARLLFAEVGAQPDEDLFLRVEYDGAIAANGATFAQVRHDFAVLSATQRPGWACSSWLRRLHGCNGLRNQSQRLLRKARRHMSLSQSWFSILATVVRIQARYAAGCWKRTSHSTSLNGSIDCCSRKALPQ